MVFAELNCHVLFAYSYINHILSRRTDGLILNTQKLQKKTQIKLGKGLISQNFVLSINNQEFENYLGQMYPAELVLRTLQRALLPFLT